MTDKHDSDPAVHSTEAQGRTFYYDPEMSVWRNAQYANTTPWERCAWILVALALVLVAFLLG